MVILAISLLGKLALLDNLMIIIVNKCYFRSVIVFRWISPIHFKLLFITVICASCTKQPTYRTTDDINNVNRIIRGNIKIKLPTCVMYQTKGCKKQKISVRLIKVQKI